MSEKFEAVLEETVLLSYCLGALRWGLEARRERKTLIKKGAQREISKGNIKIEPLSSSVLPLIAPFLFFVVIFLI